MVISKYKHWWTWQQQEPQAVDLHLSYLCFMIPRSHLGQLGETTELPTSSIKLLLKACMAYSKELYSAQTPRLRRCNAQQRQLSVYSRDLHLNPEKSLLRL